MRCPLYDIDNDELHWTDVSFLQLLTSKYTLRNIEDNVGKSPVPTRGSWSLSSLKGFLLLPKFKAAKDNNTSSITVAENLNGGSHVCM